jgi:hypothetical protein
MSDSVWSKVKALVIVSDDWGMCAWCPTVSVYEEMHTLEFMRNPWSSGTLESPADMERLFSLLEQFRGGDDLPALFMPMYIVGSPDFAAIEATGFATYADVGIDEGVPRGWERGDLAAKAREGICRGVWHPGYHARAHHFSTQRWMERLHAGDEWAHHAFGRNVYVCETVRDRVREYARMGQDEQVDWVMEGIDRFERAFGVSPGSARNSDLTPSVLDALTERGVRAVTDEGPLKESDHRLVVLPRLIQFEPFMTADHEDIVARTLADIETRWADGRPAALSTHRRNYKGFDPGDVERNFARLRELLQAVADRHPDAVYLCGDEVAQLTRRGHSIIRRGRRIICRNYGQERVRAIISAGGHEHELALLPGETIVNAASA